jgi:hypothetical protein
VSSIIGAPSSADSSTGTKMDMFTFPVLILIALGTIMFVLLALFVGTNRKRKPDGKRYDDESYYTESYYDDSCGSNESYGGDGGSPLTVTEVRQEYGGEEQQRSFLINAIPSFDGIGRSLSGAFSFLSDHAVDKGRVSNLVDPSVYEEYETTLNYDGDVRIQEVRSFVDEDFEECYSIHSIRAAADDDDELKVPDNSLASRDSMRTPPGSPARDSSKSPQRSHPSPSRVLSSPARKASSLLEKFRRNKEDHVAADDEDYKDCYSIHSVRVCAADDENQIEVPYTTDYQASNDSIPKPLPSSPGRSFPSPNRVRQASSILEKFTRNKDVDESPILNAHLSNDNQIEVPDTKSLASQDSMRTPPGSPARSSTKSSPRSYPSPSRMMSSPSRKASRILDKFTRNKEDDNLTMDAYLSDDDPIDEVDGLEVTLV